MRGGAAGGGVALMTAERTGEMKLGHGELEARKDMAESEEPSNFCPAGCVQERAGPTFTSA